MLTERNIAHRYREYTKEPLSESEIRRALELLEVSPSQVLRRRDRAFRELGLDGSEPDDRLIALMASHPTLLERPIGILGDRAIVGRPADKLLELFDSPDS